MNKHQPLLSPLIRLFQCVIRRDLYIQKMRGECPSHSFHVLRSSHYPVCQNEQRRSPTQYVYIMRTNTKVFQRQGYNNGCTRVVYTHPKDIYGCYVLHIPRSLRSFKTARTKRCKRLFIYMKPHSRLLFRKGKACLRDGFGCKSNKLYETYMNCFRQRE